LPKKLEKIINIRLIIIDESIHHILDSSDNQ